MDTPNLPIFDVLPELAAALASCPRVILTAPPGTGKTTHVPIALLRQKWLADKKIIMLEPRRLAARSAARFMARLLGEEVGQTVGYRVRMDSMVSSQTRIEVVTERILTRQLQNDPELAGTGLVIFDEFHERNLDSDLALALCLDLQGILNPDLRLLIMSATLDTEQLTAVLGGAKHISCAGRHYPVITKYAGTHTPGADRGQLLRQVLLAAGEQSGSILVFTAGSGDIQWLSRRLRESQPHKLEADWIIAPLYGNLSSREQDLAILPAPPGKRKLVIATDIAETSLTIEGIRTVIDSGLQKRPYFDPGTGLTRLKTMPVSKASADQRRGRAGRIEAGTCIRLWAKHATAGLVPYHRPEILSSDLSGLALELALWGVDRPEELQWLDPPPPQGFERARNLLRDLGAVDSKFAILPHGRQLAELPLHPRLAHMLVLAKEGGCGAAACMLAAILIEKDPLRFDRDHYQADLMLRIELIENVRNNRNSHLPHVRYAAVDHSAVRNIIATAQELRGRLQVKEKENDCDYARLLAWAYPERIGCRRSPASNNYLLSGGNGAYLNPGDDLNHSDWLVVCDLDGNQTNGRIFKAIAYDLNALEDQFHETIQWRENVQWDSSKGAVNAERCRCYQHLQLSCEPITLPDVNIVTSIILAQIRSSGLSLLPWTPALRKWQQRVLFLCRYKNNDAENPWPDVSDNHLLETLDDWLSPFLSGVKSLKTLEKIDLGSALGSLLPYHLQQQLDRCAPTHIIVPSGSRIPIDYSAETPVLAVRLQEMFGLTQTPAICEGKCPLQLHLLSPAGRPLQITSDLAGFWQTSYHSVKKDMKGRYPKHHWPDDPLTAIPTNRAKRQS